MKLRLRRVEGLDARGAPTPGQPKLRDNTGRP